LRLGALAGKIRYPILLDLIMAMELYYYNECGFSQSVLNCMTNLHCEDKIVRKNIRENPDNEKELIQLTGAKTVPVLVIDGQLIKGSEEINQFLVGKFL
jgi:glutaredoxin-related protein